MGTGVFSDPVEEVQEGFEQPTAYLDRSAEPHEG